MRSGALTYSAGAAAFALGLVLYFFLQGHAGHVDHSGHGAARGSPADGASEWSNSPLLISGDTTAGTPLDFPADFSSQRYLVNFWATWCPPCVHELPMLSAFNEAQAGNGIAVIGVAIDYPDQVRRFLDERPLSFESFLPGPTAFDLLPRKAGDPPYLPTSYLIDREGNVIAQKAGPFADLAEIEEFLGEKIGEFSVK